MLTLPYLLKKLVLVFLHAEKEWLVISHFISQKSDPTHHSVQAIHSSFASLLLLPSETLKI